MTKICRYIDDPPSFFLWELDEIVIFSMFLFLGIITDLLTYLFVVGIIFSTIVAKIKKTKSEGFLLHLLYWCGLLKLRGCQPSWKRIFIE